MSDPDRRAAPAIAAGAPQQAPAAHPAVPPAASATAHARGALAWRIFLCFASGYFMSYGLRSVNAVLAPELVAEIGLTNADLGALTSAYFFSFGMMQLPLGVWLDRFGPRRVDAVLMFVAAAGCLTFALSASFPGLWVGRALIGAGVSAGLMASLTAFRQWFPAERQTQLAAWMLMAGTAGVLTATAPVRWAVPVLGWRGVFVVAAAMLAVAGIAMWTLLPRGREQQSGKAQSFVASMSGYGQVFRSSYFWRMGSICAIVQGSFVAMQSLWIGPWFMRVLGMDPTRGAERLFLFNLFLMCCYLVLGWVAPRVRQDRDSLNRIVAVGTLGTTLVIGAITLASGPYAWLTWLALAAVMTVFTMVQPRVGLSFPAALTGRALTAFNLVMFTGVFILQWTFGFVIDAFRAAGQAEADAFRSTMQILAAALLAALVLFVAWPRLWPERTAE